MRPWDSNCHTNFAISARRLENKRERQAFRVDIGNVWLDNRDIIHGSEQSLYQHKQQLQQREAPVFFCTKKAYTTMVWPNKCWLKHHALTSKTGVPHLGLVLVSHQSELSFWVGDRRKNLTHFWLLLDRPVRYTRLAVKHIGLAGCLHKGCSDFFTLQAL